MGLTRVFSPRWMQYASARADVMLVLVLFLAPREQSATWLPRWTRPDPTGRRRGGGVLLADHSYQARYVTTKTKATTTRQFVAF